MAPWSVRRSPALVAALLLAAAAGGGGPRGAEAKVDLVRLQYHRDGFKRWAYLGKFGYGIGSGRYAMRARVEAPLRLKADTALDLETYLDEVWPEAEALADPCARREKSRKLRQVPLPASGNWGEWINGTMRQTVRPHIWYFAISDCDGILEPTDVVHRVRVEFQARQQDVGSEWDGSHFSVEQRWMPGTNATTLLGLTIVVLVFCRRCVRFHRSAGGLHTVMWALALALLMQYMGHLLHTAHLLRYSADGSGIRALEALSQVLNVLSQVVQASLLLVVARGYTLTRQNLGDLWVVPCLVAVAHIVFVLLGRAEDNTAGRNHDHEGWTGWVLMLLRLALYAWFMAASRWTAAKGGLRLQTFLRMFDFAASCYFLAFPALFVVVHLFAAYWRQPIMAVGMTVLQTVTNVWLSTFFVKPGEYFKVSTLSTSMLPGGTPRVGVDKDQ